ncbi:MAG: ribose-phosphate pyrophosphokinase [Acidobacteriota bacterium]|nr:ribose-phosphate pyrophosphokinase [Acidobacteriota bacterium]
MSALMLALSETLPFARHLSELSGIPLGQIETRRFPDGEAWVRVEADCKGRSVALVVSLDRPDSRLLPLIFLADAVRDLGATRVGLVAPYLAYLRQDRRFHTGEALTSRTFGGLLSRYVDWLVTIDPHLHRYTSLGQVYTIPNRVVHAAEAMAVWIRDHVDRPLLVGPDEESRQWLADIASRAGAPYVILSKVRHDDGTVEVTAPDLHDHHQQTPVVVDDIVSSARTMLATVKALTGARMRPAVCMAVHALFSAQAEEQLRHAGAGRLVSTNTVPHASNAIDVAPLLVEAVNELAL